MKNNEVKVTGVFEVIRIPERVQVFDDPKTHAKTVAVPFQFPDGINGVMMVSRLQRMRWTPEREIDSIIINYKDK